MTTRCQAAKITRVGSFMLAFRTYTDILSGSSESLFTFARPQTETTRNEQEKDLEELVISPNKHEQLPTKTK